MSNNSYKPIKKKNNLMLKKNGVNTEMRNIRYIKKVVKGYFDLIRPFTLLAPIIVSMCIMLASFFYNNRT
ncbi:MAG: hypothetical protein DRN24_06690, partial [Thermoplasmata archaeon]